MKFKELTNFNKRYTIELEAPRFGDAYHAGQVVRGAIVIWRKHLVTDTLFSDLSLVAMAYGCVTWFKGNSTKTACTGTERYWLQEVPLTQSKNNGDDNNIGDDCKAEGEKRLQFQFTLPTKVPSSFRLNFSDIAEGQVRYTLEAYLKNAEVDAECVSKISFEVVAATNDDRRRETVVIAPEQSSYKRTSLKRSGSVKADLRLNRTCFLPGETILLDARIENRSGTLARWTKAKFIQYTTFKANNGSEELEIKKVLFQTKWGRICDNHTQVKQLIPILVPNVPPSPFPFCKIIEIRYAVELILDPRLLLPNLAIPLKILTRRPTDEGKLVSYRKPSICGNLLPLIIKCQRREYLNILKQIKCKPVVDGETQRIADDRVETTTNEYTIHR